MPNRLSLLNSLVSSNISITRTLEVGSVSKQFIAASVLLLVERGQVSVNDDIRKYFPELASFPWHITVRQLLNHTSGLRDWGEIAEIAGCPRTTREYNHADVLNIIRRQQALNYPPGDAWSYTNTGYKLAAMLVERVSGASLREFCKKEFFIPLGMNSTQWRDDFRRIVPNRAVAGSYTSAEAQTELHIVVDYDKLVLHNSPHGTFSLSAMYADDFDCDIGNLLFSRDEAGHLAGLRLSGDRVWDLHFQRENSMATTIH